MLLMMMEMSKRKVPDKINRRYQTSVSASSYVIAKLSSLKIAIGPRPENERGKGQTFLYNNVDILEMALDALEEKLNGERASDEE